MVSIQTVEICFSKRNYCSVGSRGQTVEANQMAPLTTTKYPHIFIEGNVSEVSCPRTLRQSQMEWDLNHQPFSYSTTD